MKGRGFQQVAQGLINLGAEYGPVDVKKVLPHPSTISRKTSAVAQQVMNEFFPEVEKALKDGNCAFDTDLWTDPFTKRAYLTVECTYCTENFELRCATLFTVAFPENKKKDGKNIREVIESELLKQFAADIKKKSNVRHR